jgi:uncharacterized protein with FMN-binding domain
MFKSEKFYGGFMKMPGMNFLRAAAVLVLLPALLPACGTTGSGAAVQRTTEYQDGVYEGTGQGLRGPVAVRLRIEGGVIAELEILRHEEDKFGGGPAMEELAELVLENNSADIDFVSGATESSRGFLEAVEDALNQTRMKPAAQ